MTFLCSSLSSLNTWAVNYVECTVKVICFILKPIDNRLVCVYDAQYDNILFLFGMKKKTYVYCYGSYCLHDRGSIMCHNLQHLFESFMLSQ